MEIKVLKCPECKANLEIKDKQDLCYCQYCGCQIVVDSEKETTINKNINITYSDETSIASQKFEYEKEKQDTKIGLIFGLGIPLLIILSVIIYFSVNTAVSKSQGKVSVGNYQDLVGENFKTVKAHFESAGFDNIELIDLNDSNFFQKDGEVETISIQGDTKFESVDYFSTDSKVVITYH